ncbi:MAG: LysR family transcriptional regulator [Myxococcota bacterium]|nr:LysR family transcriptional regulator [Myxococcota bacterium]
MSPGIRFTIDQLEVLQSIERTGSFAGAARELHRVPSAISYVVRTLEEALDLQLFDRSRRRAVLTPAGRRVLEKGAAVIEEARTLDALAFQIRTGWEPDLHVVVDGVVPLGPVTGALRTFREEEIPTRIRLDVEYQEGVPDRWESEDADLMICLDIEDGEDTLDRTQLPDLQLLRVAAADHPLARIEGAERELLLEYMELVVRDSSPRYARRPRRPFSGTQHLTTLSDFHTKRLALLEGAGFGWMPRHLVEEDLAAGSLVPLRTGEADEWTYHPELVHRKSRPLGQAGRRFVQLFLEMNRKTV